MKRRSAIRTTMAKPQICSAILDPAPDFLTHLQRAFGWSEEQAIEALGAYMLSSKAGRALRRELDSVEGNPSLNAA